MTEASTSVRETFLRERSAGSLELIGRLFTPWVSLVGILVAAVGTGAVLIQQSVLGTVIAFVGYLVALALFSVFVTSRRARFLGPLIQQLNDESDPASDPGSTSDLPRWMLEPADASSPEALDAIMRPRGADLADFRASSGKTLRAVILYQLVPFLLACVAFALVIAAFALHAGDNPGRLVVSVVVLALVGVPSFVMQSTLRRFNELQVRISAVRAEQATRALAGMPVSSPPFTGGLVVKFADDRYFIDRHALRPRVDSANTRLARLRRIRSVIPWIAGVAVLIAAIAFALEPFSGRIIL